MSDKKTVWLIVIAVIAFLLFGDEIIGLAGSILGAAVELSVSLIVWLLIVGGVFFVVTTVFGSTLLGFCAAFIALVLSGISFFWPLLLCLFVLYLVFRKPRVSRAP
ncbi:hypothetical protein [Idiomarina piscisalsi]|uniref:Uncharacterized protein n=1 Tax=Idiomarina piscisalsi TaxID=1096243 RepID=A0A432YR46_9GAMM|nr:hypothetical protein [Idiomarina piscisalsi]RUO64117.1 hypothetical protein CWI73_08100 [Idiomarina piscisalsi]